MAVKPARAPKTAAKAKSDTITLKDMVATISESQEMTKVQTAAILGQFIEIMGKSLKKGAKVRISGFGIFTLRRRAARKGHNPATGEAIKVKASKTIGFRPGKELKESL